jgi:hypothetical protein
VNRGREEFLLRRKVAMNWHYVACLFAGMFLTNAVPHFVQGICGNRFPTPFAKPPGKGLSSPVVNVVWGLGNLVVGVMMFRVGRLVVWDRVGWSVFFVGVAALSIMCSANFAHKHAA